MRPLGDHFYTASAAERDGAVASFGYVFEGIAGWTPIAGQPGTTPFFRLVDPGNGDHLYTTSAAERDNAIASFGYVSEGVACDVFPTASAGTTPLFRLLGNGDHFYTTSAAERDNAIASFGYVSEGVACHVFGADGANRASLFRLLKARGARVRLHLKVIQNYVFEGIACHVFPAPAAFTSPFFRLMNPGTGHHFYTTSAAERDQAIANLGYINEGVQCHVFTDARTGTMPLLRLMRPAVGDHLYTTSVPERDLAIASFGYVDEGVACHVFPGAGGGTTPLFRLAHQNGDHFYTTSAAERDAAVSNPGPTVAIPQMVQSMQQVYDTVGIFVDVASQQNLSLPDLVDTDIGGCVRGRTTPEQDQLFSNRDNADSDDLVIYFVRATPDNPVNGCAAHPNGRPGAIVTMGATRWTLAHEVGHVLGLNHLSPETCPPAGAAPIRLMTGCGTGTIVQLPPDLIAAEGVTMDNSPLTEDI